MTARQINFILWTAAALLTSAAAVVLVAAVMVPIEAPPTQATLPAASTTPVDLAKDILDADEVVWSRSLRSLTADTTAPAAAMPQTEDGLRIRLVGTVGHSLALLATPEGVVVVRAVGESLAGAEVITVEPLRVELRYNGKVVTLTKPPPATNG